MDSFDPHTDYPLSTARPDLVQTPSGLALEDLKIENLRDGLIPDGDFRVTAETLRRQAAVARSAGRDPLGANLERAAELATMPNQLILELYSALRPGRSTRAELEAWAQRLERDLEAPLVATFVREASLAYEAKGILG